MAAVTITVNAKAVAKSGYMLEYPVSIWRYSIQRISDNATGADNQQERPKGGGNHDLDNYQVNDAFHA